MTDDVENSAAASPAPSPPSAPTKNPRGRPPKVAAKETAQQRIERLEAELTKAREAKKLAEQHQESIVGAAVVRHARADDKFRRQLAALLRAEVKGKADLAAIAELLT